MIIDVIIWKNITLSQNTPYSEAVSFLIIPESDSSIPQAIFAVECVTLQYFFVANKSNERVLCCASLWWIQIIHYWRIGGQSSFLNQRTKRGRFCFSDPYRHIFILNCILTRKIILVTHLSKPILFRKRFAISEALNLKSINQWFLILPYNRDDLSAKHYRLSINS